MTSTGTPTSGRSNGVSAGPGASRRSRGVFPATRRSLQAAAYDRTFRSDEEAVSYHYAGRNDHLPDFANPTWMNEKVRWQFLNHPNPLIQIAADKVGGPRLPALQGRPDPRARALGVGTTRRGLPRRRPARPLRPEVGLGLGPEPLRRGRLARDAAQARRDCWPSGSSGTTGAFSANCTIAASRSAGSPRRSSGRPSGSASTSSTACRASRSSSCT